MFKKINWWLEQPLTPLFARRAGVVMAIVGAFLSDGAFLMACLIILWGYMYGWYLDLKDEIRSLKQTSPNEQEVDA